MHLQVGRLVARRIWSPTTSLLRPHCSKDDDRGKDDSRGDRLPTDWDKAWSSFSKPRKKSLFSNFNPDKYVSRNPRRSEYPMSEEIDPIRKTERSNLMLWTSPRFTLIGAIVIVSILLVYTILFPLK